MSGRASALRDGRHRKPLGVRRRRGVRAASLRLRREEPNRPGVASESPRHPLPDLDCRVGAEFERDASSKPTATSKTMRPSTPGSLTLLAGQKSRRQPAICLPLLPFAECDLQFDVVPLRSIGCQRTQIDLLEPVRRGACTERNFVLDAESCRT